MKKITLDEVKKLATLSALEFDESELDQFSSDFESILDMVDEIKNCEVDSKLSYKSHKFEDLREDLPHESFSQEKALQNSPKTRKGAFAVSQMLEGD